ncbi:MAG: hypothetical protein H6834_11360 [Planctomycetes bacterium]|nr:hypothetical protein [Planctomycetota bacterium]
MWRKWKPRFVYCVSVILMGLAGCGSTPWDVETEYVIEDLNTRARAEIIRVLANADYGYEATPAGDDSVLRFVLTGVDDMDQLRAVQVLIQDVSEETKVPVALQGATMRFASVSGTGKATISVSGTATPGSSVLLDIGAERAVEASMNDAGRWEAGIERSAQLVERGGWIYGTAFKRGPGGKVVESFFKINVMSSDGSQPIAGEDLPSDSVLRRE